MATTCTCDRRDLLRRGLAAGAGASLPFLLPRVAFAAPGEEAGRDTLVCVFLRGGMDGLSAVVPHGDAAYHDARARTRVRDDEVLDIDGYFGLHPALAPLQPLWDDGLVGAVHAAGSPDPTRSHFDAMDYMERGTPGDTSRPDGWLARHLLRSAGATPFEAIGVARSLPMSLRGYAPALAIASLEEFHLDAPDGDLDAVSEALAAMYDGSDDALSAEAARTFATVAELAERVPTTDRRGAEYPRGDLGDGLRQVASLVHADVGLQVACVDMGGWDLHESMGDASDGRMAGLLTELGSALAAFAQDLGDRLGDVTLVTMSEFGRRVRENGSGGTDHGHGNVMLLLGGGVRGGAVHGTWPGLSPDALDRGDLAITTDYRDVLGEVLARRRAEDDLSEVFPGHTPTSVEVVSSRVE